MSKDRIQIVLVGIGGYGAFYISALELPQIRDKCNVCAVVDPMGESSPNWSKLAASGVKRFDSLAEFLDADIQADLAVISSPIAFHADQACAALNAGINVLCEKPMTATVQDAQRMAAAQNTSGKFLEIGYQWSFSAAIQALKQDMVSGVFGVPQVAKTWVSWPRTKAYYHRNAWAGHIRDSQGRWVYDSPANNATAHYLHNMLYLLGSSIDRAATPVSVTAECYRANPIENFDALCCRIETSEGADVLFFTAHCVKECIGPEFRFECDKAVVEYRHDTDIVARFADGHEKNYGDPNLEPERKLFHCIDRIENPEKYGAVCPPAAAAAQTLCINAIQKTPIHEFDRNLVNREIVEDEDELIHVTGLEEAMRQGFEREKLFSELGLPWAAPAAFSECT